MDKTHFISKLKVFVHLAVILMLQLVVYQQAHSQGADTTSAPSPRFQRSYSPAKIYEFSNKDGKVYQRVEIPISSNKDPDKGESEKSRKQTLKILYPVGPGSGSREWGTDWRNLVDKIIREKQRVNALKREAAEKYAPLNQELAKKNAALNQDEAQRRAILSKTKMDVMRETLLRFPAEQVKFAIAQGAVVYHQSWLKAEGDPRAMAEFYETVTDPMAAIGFYFFMLANGFTTDMLSKYGARNLDVKNRTILFRYMKYAGMSAGLMASSIFHEASETFKACALLSYRNYDGKTLKERELGRKEKDKACDESWRIWHTENILKRYVPMLFGMALGTAIQGSMGQLVHWAKDTPPGKAVFGKALDLTMTWKAGRFIIQRAHPVLAIGSIFVFLDMDHYITPTLTRGYGILSDSLGTTWDSWWQTDLEKMAQKCLPSFEVLKNHPSNSAWMKMNKKCSSDLNESILSWRDIHTNWRLNINSEYEAARQTYTKFVKNIVTQYSTAQSYYLKFLSARFKDIVDKARLAAKIILPENAASVQDHLNRIYPFFGVFLGGASMRDSFPDRTKLRDNTAYQYLGEIVKLEQIQEQRVRLLGKVMFNGLRGLTPEQASVFFLDNFGLFEHLILGKLKQKSITWARANPRYFGERGVLYDDYYQWIKEHILKVPERTAEAISFSNDVIIPLLLETSEYWQTGLSIYIDQKDVKFIPEHHKELVDLRKFMLSEHKTDLIRGLLQLNAILFGDQSKSRATIHRASLQIEVHQFLVMIRSILGNPYPILYPGMAYPYISRAHTNDDEKYTDRAYRIPKKYPYSFFSAADYLTHEMICGGEKSKIEWDHGSDAVFHPPKIVTGTPESRSSFCGQRKLLSADNTYEALYAKKVSIFPGEPLIGVIPNILANLIPELDQVNAAKAIQGADTSERDASAFVEESKIFDWWKNSAGNELDSFFEVIEKTWLITHEKLRFNLTRSNDDFRESKWGSFLSVVNPILERARAGRQLPYNLIAALMVEWDQYIKVAKVFNADKSLDAEIAAVESAFVDSMKYLTYLSKIEFTAMKPAKDDPTFEETNNKLIKERFDMNISIIDLDFALNQAIDKLKTGLEKKDYKLGEILADGMASTSRAIVGYMESATLIGFDPSLDIHRAAKAQDAGKKRVEDAVSRATKGSAPIKH
ncbi:MAG: hypothetical protein JNM39_01620 [Bdellovibrionaceae bacterium]|nr:hypothetical protein [Pseudobdellovibrionaceae bacterium]